MHIETHAFRLEVLEVLPKQDNVWFFSREEASIQPVIDSF